MVRKFSLLLIKNIIYQNCSPYIWLYANKSALWDPHAGPSICLIVRMFVPFKHETTSIEFGGRPPRTTGPCSFDLVLWLQVPRFYSSSAHSSDSCLRLRTFCPPSSQNAWCTPIPRCTLPLISSVTEPTRSQYTFPHCSTNVNLIWRDFITVQSLLKHQKSACHHCSSISPRCYHCFSTQFMPFFPSHPFSKWPETAVNQVFAQVPSILARTSIQQCLHSLSWTLTGPSVRW